MARLLSCGFELQSVAANVEITTNGLGGTDGIDTSTFRSGLASLRITLAASFSWVNYQWKGTANSGEAFVRVCMNFSSLPGAGTVELFTLSDNVAVNQALYVRYNATGTLLQLIDNAGAVIGSSPAVTTGTWYVVEVRAIGGVGTGTAVARLNGVQFASSTTATVADFNSVYLGVAFAASTITYFFDDIAINDTTGTVQNSFPGLGKIIHLQPNAAGDNNAWTVQVGGTAGAANNFSRVKEITPNDVIDYNGEVLSGNTDDYNLLDTPSAIAASDTIVLVQVGVRYRAVVAAAEAAFQLRIKKASGGTVTSSTAITPNATAFKTNANAVPRIYPLTLYVDPDASNWTKATLDTTQIGYNISTTNTNAANISTVWLLIESLAATTTTTHFLSLLGAGT